MASDALLFYIFAAVTVIGALMVVTQKNPVYSVLSIIMAVFGLAGLYVLLALELGWALSRTSGLAASVNDQSADQLTIAVMGQKIFTDYMFAFEVTSILIIASMVGAVVLAKKRED